MLWLADRHLDVKTSWDGTAFWVFRGWVMHTVSCTQRCGRLASSFVEPDSCFFLLMSVSSDLTQTPWGLAEWFLKALRLSFHVKPNAMLRRTNNAKSPPQHPSWSPSAWDLLLANQVLMCCFWRCVVSSTKRFVRAKSCEQWMRHGGLVQPLECLGKWNKLRSATFCEISEMNNPRVYEWGLMKKNKRTA